MVWGIMLAIYGIEVFKYSFVFDMIYHKKIHNRWISIIGAVVVSIISFWKISYDTDRLLLTYVTVLLVIYLQMGEKFGKRTGRLLLMAVLINSVDEIFVPIESGIESIMAHVANIQYWGRLISSCLGLVLLLVIWRIYQRLKSKNHYSEQKYVYVYVVIILSSVMLLATITMLNLCKNLITDGNLISSIDVTVLFSHVSLCMLLWLLLFFQKENMTKRKLLKAEMELRETQANYYQLLLCKEEETKKFRHDINNHLFCLSELAEKEDMREIKNYLNRLNESVITIQNILYTTGNDLFDAILNEKLSMLSDEVKINIQGRFIHPLSLEPIDICTIFSNLLQNAVEELNNNICEDKFFELTIISGTCFTEIRMENSIRNGIDIDEDGLPRTKKKDSANHGFGLRNAKEVIEGQGGTMEIANNSNSFAIIVRFMNK